MKVTFIKSHPQFAYFPGDVADISPEFVQDMIQSGHVILFPGVDEKQEDPQEDKKKGTPKRAKKDLQSEK